jgi:hypothetical protein
VAPAHARIAPDEAGVLWARDLGTRNRLRASRSGAPVDSLRLGTPGLLVVGGTRLRVRRAADALAPELAAGRGGWAERPVIIAVACLVALALSAFETWTKTIGDATFAPYVTFMLAIAGVVVVWAGLWAAVGRLVSKRLEFLPHLAIGATALIAWSVVDDIAMLLSYAFAWPAAAAYEYFGQALVVGGAVYLHLSRATPRRRAVGAVAALAALAVIAIFALPAWESTGRIAVASRTTRLYPPYFRIAAPIPPEEFLARSTRLARVTAAARRPDPSGAPDEDDDDD